MVAGRWGEGLVLPRILLTPLVGEGHDYGPPAPPSPPLHLALAPCTAFAQASDLPGMSPGNAAGACHCISTLQTTPLVH